MSIFYSYDIDNTPFTLILVFFIFCGLGAIVWWRKHVTNKYQKQVFKRNESFYENRIKEYEKEREELLNQNAELSKIIHRDNKLIPAMILAVKEVAAKAENNTELQNLLSQLEKLSSEHMEIIDTYQAKDDNLPKTDNIALDAVLRYLSSRAAQSGVGFNLEVVKESIPPLLSKITDITDLSTVLCDLGENAIIAAKGIQNGRIGISFNFSDNSPYFSFYDNGALFDEKVIANMGRNRITTHKIDGGSGIGLMALFEILEKYNASFCINESSENTGFTKCLKITFDDSHKISILTERKAVRRICSYRADLVTA